MNPSSAARLSAVALIGVVLSTASPAEESAEVNAVIELTELAEEGMNVRVLTTRDLPIFVNRRAGRVLDILAAKQTLTILAMDRYGLQVRGRGKNGPLTGWIGQKKAFDDKRLQAVQAFYERQLQIEKYVAEKRPAIGMNLTELKRILGNPTNHNVGVGTGLVGRTESLTWIIKQKVDLNELLASGTDEDLLKMEVEVGRVEVALARGLATAINMKLEGGAADIPTVVPPVEQAFGPAPNEVAGK